MDLPLIKKIPELKIGNIEIYPPLLLAPLAEITDVYLRPIVKKMGGVGLAVTEMVSSEGLTRGNKQTVEMLDFKEEERPISVQIYGANPVRMADAATIAEEAGADIIDINFGCPAKKIIRGKSGVALMKDMVLAEKIITDVVKAVKVPVTVKTRLGWNNTDLNYIEFGKMAENAGAALITLHARTGKQHYSFEPRREAWNELAQVVSIPVIANGDIKSYEDVQWIFENTECRGAMIGRAALKNPFIFRIIYAKIIGENYRPTKKDIGKYFLEYYESIKANQDQRFVIHKLRIMGGWLSHGFKNGNQFRRRISSLTEDSFFIDAILEFFELEELDVAE
jgi:nifR3 family TIM-barrel protein